MKLPWQRKVQPVERQTREVTDPNDPRLGHGPNDDEVGQNEAYLVLPAEKRAEGHVRPVRLSYVHTSGCGARTTMSQALAETYAVNPKFYGSTYCCGCHKHRVVAEFTWDGTDQLVGS